VHCGQVAKQICEQHCREGCKKVCRQVTECCHREVCCQVKKCIEECCTKQVCVPCTKTVQETCYKDCTRRICEPCTTMKTVTRRVVECVEEPVDPCGRAGWLSRLFGGRDGCCDPCPPAKNDCADPCFDPCAGKNFHPLERLRSAVGSRRNDCCDTTKCCAPACPTTRKVWRVRCITEQVPCTTYVTRCITEKVPYTVCRQVKYTEVRNVPYTVRRTVRGAYVDDKGVGHECDAPGRVFKQDAVARKLVPYTVTRNVTTIEKHMVPYTVSRCAKGAYVDDKGEGHATEGPGRVFKEKAHYKVVHNYTTCRMVEECCVKKVQYTVYENICEKQIKRVPYQVCRMVPHTVTKKVAYKVCEQEKYTVCKRVRYTECVMQPHTVKCKVPYTVCETVPCTVTKQVKVCVPETVCVKRARLVPVTVACEAPACPPAKCCETDCCERNRCFLSNLRQRWFASLSTTGCCEQKTTCNDCHDYCREGLLQRLFRNRFACDAGCGDGGCAPTTTTAPKTSEPVAPPKKLPSN
jgi:hypothetical protein